MIAGGWLVALTTLTRPVPARCVAPGSVPVTTSAAAAAAAGPVTTAIALTLVLSVSLSLTLTLTLVLGLALILAAILATATAGLPAFRITIAAGTLLAAAILDGACFIAASLSARPCIRRLVLTGPAVGGLPGTRTPFEIPPRWPIATARGGAIAARTARPTLLPAVGAATRLVRRAR